jgi:carotenoid cleavage dioxygenase-like enzyme
MTATQTTASTQTAVRAASTTAATDPYLRGNFAPVAGESSLLEHELEVEGELPKDLNGLLLRNGPNPAGEVPAGHHWFVGDRCCTRSSSAKAARAAIATAGSAPRRCSR